MGKGLKMGEITLNPARKIKFSAILTIKMARKIKKSANFKTKSAKKV